VECGAAGVLCCGPAGRRRGRVWPGCERGVGTAGGAVTVVWAAVWLSPVAARFAVPAVAGHTR